MNQRHETPQREPMVGPRILTLDEQRALLAVAEWVVSLEDSPARQTVTLTAIIARTKEALRV